MLFASGQFDEDALAFVMGTFDACMTNEGTGQWFSSEEDWHIIGVAYVNPEPVTVGTWNLLLLWVDPNAQGKGVGRDLVNNVRSHCADHGARLLIVETSGSDAFLPARAFYYKIGFMEEARVRNFFSDGEDKIICTMPLLG
jgi:ribosomal protein S18 acetylase RimI-like enzyme